MKFLPGQSGNPLGRPKKPNIYTAYKDEYFSKKPRSNKRIMNNLYKAAEAGLPWAIKEWLRIYIPQATIHIDSTSTELSEKRVMVFNAIDQLSAEEERALFKALNKSNPHMVSVKAEVIDEHNVEQTPILSTKE